MKKIRNIMQSVTILLGLALSISIVIGTVGTVKAAEATDVQDIEEYDGPVGPGNALYGLKIAMENIDESFTFNASEKLGKQLSHARLRLAEAKSELKKQNSKAAERALERYKEKSEEADLTISRFSGVNRGLPNAQEMIKKHQAVLERLNETHPNNQGLLRAIANSKRLQEKFREKVEKRGERGVIEEEARIKIKAQVIGNDTEVNVELKFMTNSTANDTIAEDILERLRLSSENISQIIKISAEEDEKEQLKTALEAEAEIEGNFSKVGLEYRFPLNNTTNRTDIIEGVRKELLDLNISDILSVLEIKVKEEGMEIAEKEKKGEIKEEKKAIKEERREKNREKPGSDIKKED